MAYTKYNNDWKNSPDTSTPITEAALDWIEAGIAAAAVVGDAAVPKPASIASGEVPVWNGSAFVRSSVTRVGRSSITPVPAATALPGSPVDGDQVILTDSLSAPTYQWLLQYVAAKATNKWIFIGGSPANGDIDTDESSTTVTTWLDLATVGPTFTIPVAGTYDASAFVGAYHSASSATMYAGVAIGATTPTAHLQLGVTIVTASQAVTITVAARQAYAANDALRVRYYNGTTGTAHWVYRHLFIQPVAIGG